MDVRKLKVVPILAALTVWIASCTSATPTADFVPTLIVAETPTASQEGLPLTEADVPRVSLEEALTAIQSGEAIVVDVRNAQSYQASHIAGALSIPLSQIETDPTGLSLEEDQWIITYCT